MRREFDFCTKGITKKGQIFFRKICPFVFLTQTLKQRVY